MSVPVAVVLVEGESDAVVVRTVAAGHGLAGAVEVLAMGGVTNTARHVRLLADRDPAPAVLGLCDARERRFLERADPPLAGIFVCDRDLEDELIRAVGPEQVLDVLDGLGELDRFRTFQGQPEWRGRDLADQLHRFAGTPLRPQDGPGRRPGCPAGAGGYASAAGRARRVPAPPARGLRPVSR